MIPLIGVQVKLQDRGSWHGRHIHLLSALEVR
jgi:hypothetical protein